MDLRGICDPATALTKFTLTRVAPDAALAPFVQHYWIVEWDLTGQPGHEQRVLPHPMVHVTFRRGHSRIAGVIRGHFTQRIEGRGHVLGVRFRPGGFRPFLGAPVSTITDRFLPLESVFPPSVRQLDDTAPADEMATLVDRFLAVLAPPADPHVTTIDGLVARVADDPGLVRVDALAREAGLGVRALQRLFADYVGVGPKWVIRRARIQEAAQRAVSGGTVDWAELAADLRYSDQAHFVRDFTALVGTTPTRYARPTTPPTGYARPTSPPTRYGRPTTPPIKEGRAEGALSPPRVLP